MELAKLQADNPIASKKVIYYEQFKDWDGSTGAFLKYDNWVKRKAEYLLELRKHNES